MANLAQVLKEEVARLARKEIRAAIAPLQAQVKTLKTTVKDQKTTITALERKVRKLEKKVLPAEVLTVETADDQARISTKGIISLRKKLELTRAEMGLLVGVNQNTVYMWEQDKSAPRAEAKAKMIALRGLGKREVKRLLEEAQ